MESRIGHLHCRVRAAPGARVPPGLDRLTRERVGAALGEALEATLGDDPGVYVLRSVRADLAVNVSAHAPDGVIAGRRADRLAAAVTRKIADDRDETVVRFADEAQFIACFASDLADGVAWEQWFYGAFAGLRPLGGRQALRRVLIENRARLPAILGWLARRGTLERVLAALDPQTLAALGRQLPDPELARPLVSTALRIAEALGLAIRPAREELLARYLAASEVVPSWRDRASLADGVLDAFRFLLRDGHVRLPETAGAGETQHELGSLLAPFDWLDVERLRLGLDALLTRRAQFVGPRARAALSDRDRAVMRELAAAIGDDAPALDARDVAGGANALRLQAALATHTDDAAALRMAPSTIARVLAAIGRLARSGAATELWSMIAVGAAQDAWRRYAEAGGSPADVEVLAAAEPLVRSLALGGAGAAGAGAGWLESPCAGALLPVRAALDLRLPALAATVDGAPRFPELLLAVALRWGGDQALGRRADAALAAALGFERPPTAAELAKGWAGCPRAAHLRLRAQLRDLLEARGLTLAVDAADRAALAGGKLGHRMVDDTVALIAVAALRAWVAWLRGFASSSAPFVLRELVRRAGAVALLEGRATVELERRPLDLVLDMAGYLDALDAGAALPRRIDFVLLGA